MKTIPILVQGAINIPLSKLRPIQGDLKEMAPEDFVALREKLLKGFKFTFHVWKEKPKNDWWYIIDGHGRDVVLHHLVDRENYKEPKIPCSIVQGAKTLEEAKLLVLDSSSTYNRIKPEGLRDYMKELKLKPEALQSYRLLEVNIPMFTREFFPESLDKKEDKEKGEPKNVSFDAYQNAAIKQITLLYSADEYEVVIKKLEELQEKYKVEDFSQVVWRLLAQKN